MSQNKRQRQILEKLYQRRHDTCANPAQEFGVSERTIMRDVQEPMLEYPFILSRENTEESGWKMASIFIGTTFPLSRERYWKTGLGRVVACRHRLLVSRHPPSRKSTAGPAAE